MKIVQQKVVKFDPVTITIESAEEMAVLLLAINNGLSALNRKNCGIKTGLYDAIVDPQIMSVRKAWDILGQ